MLVDVLAHLRRQWLVKERQVEVFDIHELKKLGIATLLRDFLYPFGHSLALATGPRASDDDGNSKHKFLLCGFSCMYSIFTLARINDLSSPSLLFIRETR